MPTYTQAERPIAITTPLGKDILLLTGFRGHEAISQLFNFQLELLAEAQSEVRFDRILGQNVTVELQLVNQEKRYFNGLVKRFSQGARDDAHFIHFRAEVVPKPWLLTKKVRSRIFQHLSVPDILRQVFSELDVTYELSGTYHPRDYCVQYRESDFDFASRLMEEEGIYYFFKHTDSNHPMVVTDVSKQHPFVSGQSNVIYEELGGGDREDMRISAWEKSQDLRSGECTLWDHCFELPGNHLEAKQKILDSVTVGKVTHKLKVGGNDQLEIYDYPGAYAQRFDGIDHHGAPRQQDLQEIFQDKERTVKLRMEQEQAMSLEIVGAGNCGQFLPGHKFTLKRHFDADSQYLLTRVEHEAQLGGDYRSDEALPFHYANHFRSIPVTLPYRPQCVTPEPVIAGIQTATVVGPKGEEIFCDKYGRIKVQFHWDREGKMDGDSSCWVRVAQAWAGKGWGAFFWPRIGHEVVVVFEEGDPDQPLIIGSVYNAENMPWYTLPANKQLGGFKSASVHGTAQKHYNAVVFNDMKGREHLAIHSERNLSLNSEYDKMIHAGRHKGEHVSVANMLTVGNVIPGGGSGGSANDSYGKGFDNQDPVPEPPPLGVLGLNSVMVYGQNMQAATGLNHQLAVGNNIQICVNPFGLAAGVTGTELPQLLAAVLGAGMGGNMQLTFGANASVTVGQAFEINIGPPKVQVDARYAGGDDHTNPDGTVVKDPTHLATTIFSGLVGVAAIVWIAVYAAETEDHTRAVMTMVFQALIDVLLGAMMTAEMFTKKAVQDPEKKTWSLAYQIEPVERQAGEFDWAALDFTTAIGAAAAILGPLLAVSGENQTDSQPN